MTKVYVINKITNHKYRWINESSSQRFQKQGIFSNVFNGKASEIFMTFGCLHIFFSPASIEYSTLIFLNSDPFSKYRFHLNPSSIKYLKLPSQRKDFAISSKLTFSLYKHSHTRTLRMCNQIYLNYFLVRHTAKNRYTSLQEKHDACSP